MVNTLSQSLMLGGQIDMERIDGQHFALIIDPKGGREGRSTIDMEMFDRKHFTVCMYRQSPIADSFWEGGGGRRHGVAPSSCL